MYCKCMCREWSLSHCYQHFIHVTVWVGLYNLHQVMQLSDGPELQQQLSRVTGATFELHNSCVAGLILCFYLFLSFDARLRRRLSSSCWDVHGEPDGRGRSVSCCCYLQPASFKQVITEPQSEVYPTQWSLTHWCGSLSCLRIEVLKIRLCLMMFQDSYLCILWGARFHFRVLNSDQM